MIACITLSCSTVAPVHLSYGCQTSYGVQQNIIFSTNFLVTCKTVAIVSAYCVYCSGFNNYLQSDWIFSGGAQELKKLSIILSDRRDHTYSYFFMHGYTLWVSA